MDEDSPFKIFQSLNSEKQNQGKKGDQGLGTQIQSSVKKPAAKLAEQKEDQNCSHFFLTVFYKGIKKDSTGI